MQMFVSRGPRREQGREGGGEAHNFPLGSQRLSVVPGGKGKKEKPTKGFRRSETAPSPRSVTVATRKAARHLPHNSRHRNGCFRSERHVGLYACQETRLFPPAYLLRARDDSGSIIVIVRAIQLRQPRSRRFSETGPWRKALILRIVLLLFSSGVAEASVDGIVSVSG